jgi:C1A family cysteine protease
MIHALLLLLGSLTAMARLPLYHKELLPFVQMAPDQGETSTCLFMASTGAMELIANKKHNIRRPVPNGPYDLSEAYAIHGNNHEIAGKYFWEVPVLKFNHGYGIHTSKWPVSAWSGNWEDQTIWKWQDSSAMKKVKVPKVETIPLFVIGNKYSTNVLDKSHIQQIKQALVKYDAPVLVNYVDDDYWHVVLIVGYDDRLPGTCYEVEDIDCEKDLGSFFVRDSFGLGVEVRDYDWFRMQGNAAFVVKEAKVRR